MQTQRSPDSAGGNRPDLYFGAKEIPSLRKRFETKPHLAARWLLLRRNADALLTARVTSGAVDITRTRAALGITGITAFAHALTGERRYAERAIREAEALLSEVQWTKPGPGSRGANLGTGEACMACALAYDWCHGAMTEAERASFRERLVARGLRPYLDAVGPLKDWWRDNDVTNWNGVVNGGCGLAALALYDGVPEAKQAVDAAWPRIQSFLKTANRADGGGDEGVMYYTYGMLFANYFAVAAARRFGDDRGVFRDAVDKMAGYWLLHMRGPDDRYANFNDMGDDTFAGLPPKHPEGGPNATLCALWEARTPGGDRLLAWAADHGGDNYYWRGASPFYLLFRGDSPTVRERPALQKSVLFRDSGQAIWDAGPRLWFAFNGGWTSDRSHYNLDLGSFILVADGERLIWDPGYGKFKTADHSTVLVGGREQVKGARASWRAWAEGPGWRYLACDLSAAYGLGNSGRCVRHAVLLEGGRNTVPTLLLVDDLTAPEPTEWESRLQIKGELTLDAPGSAVVRGKTAALAIRWAASPGATVEIGQGQGASAYLSARVPARRATLLATLLQPGSPGATPPTLTIAGAEGQTVTLTVTSADRQPARLQFAPTPNGMRLAAIDGRPVTDAPGPTRRTLRRV
jgi:hypothetical protein